MRGEQGNGHNHQMTPGTTERDHEAAGRPGQPFWARLFGRLPIVTWRTDAELRIIEAEGGALVALGLAGDHLTGLSLVDLLASADVRGSAIGAHRRALAGEAAEGELAWNGRCFQLWVEPIHDALEPTRAVGTVCVALDVTEGRRATQALRERDEELRAAVKLQSLGERARALGQDIGAQVSALESQLHALLGGPASEDARRAVVGEVGAAIERLAAAAAHLMGNVPAGREVAAGGETILLVDDEPTVRGFVKRALEHFGYRVLEAGGADEALALGEAYSGHIDLLLADVVLPGMNGPQVAARLAPLRPEMRILYMTGFADDALVHRGVVSAGQQLLVKPFSTLGLAHEVKKILRP
jgi:CheY-like chemotaxis protein